MKKPFIFFALLITVLLVVPVYAQKKLPQLEYDLDADAWIGTFSHQEIIQLLNSRNVDLNDCLEKVLQFFHSSLFSQALFQTENDIKKHLSVFRNRIKNSFHRWANSLHGADNDKKKVSLKIMGKVLAQWLDPEKLMDKRYIFYLGQFRNIPKIDLYIEAKGLDDIFSYATFIDENDVGFVRIMQNHDHNMIAAMQWLFFSMSFIYFYLVCTMNK